MFKAELEQLQLISTTVGVPVDYTQGGGGNTSAKLNEELMAVKASGFKLKQITPTEGYVVVDYQKIRNYFEQVDLNSDTDFEKESVEVVKSNIVQFEGIKALRPSVEAGFHSVLKKYVIHTHSVYANIICCATTGRELMAKIFSDQEYGIAWIPYINPGFCLTLKIKEAIQNSIKSTGKYPEVIFMENHGLIVTNENSTGCIELHREVNELIKSYFGINEYFPKITLTQAADNQVVSKTPYLYNYFRGRNIKEDFFDGIVLYPDQLVYLNGNIAINGTLKKLNINTATGEVIYNTSIAEAQTIEETLLAYLYVVENIKKNELTIKTMSDKQIDFIKNWESEAYRKSLVKDLRK